MTKLDSQRQKQLEDLEKKLGLSFLNKMLLHQALTHSSYNHQFGGGDNERMEFLGDAVLKLVISENIYHRFPEKAEGDLTKIRASVISDETLGRMAALKRMGDHILMSRNECASGGAERKSNLANSMEALFGAIFIDSGIGKARQIILELLSPEIDRVSKKGYIADYKSTLQELAQKNRWMLPQYRVVEEKGPRHKKTFMIQVKIRGKIYGTGSGNNKKEAEQQAAEQAYKKLKKEPVKKATRPPYSRGPYRYNRYNRYNRAQTQTQAPAKPVEKPESGIQKIIKKVKRSMKLG